MAKPWDRKPDEPADAYKAFRVWIEHQNSVRNTSEFCLVLRDSGIQFTRKTVETYRLRYKWKARARAYENWVRRKTELKIAATATRNKTLILEKRSESTLKAVTMALSYLDQLPPVVTEDAASRTIANINNAMDAIKKVMEAVGLGCVDVDDLREELEGLVTRKAKAITVAVREPSPEELLGLCDESGDVQPASSEAAGLLEPPSRDMSGSSESGDPNGSGSIG